MLRHYRKCLLACAFLLELAISRACFAQSDSQPAQASQPPVRPASAAENTAQDAAQAMPSMPGMPDGEPVSMVHSIEQHATSGTDLEPAATPHPGWMIERGAWRFMFHGDVFINELQQTGPRGGDKFFSTSWLMPMAQRRVGHGTLTARAMFSLEPATVTGRFYPELFQIGETAFGKSIVDGQHPHNFFMEIAALYDWRISENGLVSFYAAPVGDPAMGPIAYAHRTSASEDPIAVLGHHLQDSTHIAWDVVTAGYTYRVVRVEVSGFHGREPNENRWNLQAGAIDSWSARLTLNPAPNWSGQFSLGTIHSPEALSPLEDQRRMTASIGYDRPLSRGNWASTAIWGRTCSMMTGEILNSYLIESTLHFAARNAVWSRIENVDRTNLLLVGMNPLPAGFEERFLARVQAYTAGYDREFPVLPHVSTALGGQATLYAKPSSLDAIYGPHPMGFVVFIRLRPEGSMN